MNRRLLAALFVFAAFVAVAEGAVARLAVEIGKEARFDFGENMILIKRNTKAHSNTQYLFSSPNQDGSWTTDGKNKIPSHAHLYWNGTLVISKVTKDDLGSYEMPLEAPRPHLAKTMIDFVLREEGEQ